MKINSFEIELIRSKRKSLALEIKPDGRIIARAPLLMSERDIKRFVTAKSEWIEKSLLKLSALDNTVPLTKEEIRSLYQLASEIIPQRVERYAKKIGVEYGRVTIRMQKTKWGSCSAKGNLNFNCLLMLTPIEIIDSVVIHELCHIKELNHSAVFYNEVLRYCPEYYKHNKWLKENGTAIMARAFAKR